MSKLYHLEKNVEEQEEEEWIEEVKNKRITLHPREIPFVVHNLPTLFLLLFNPRENARSSKIS